MNVKVKDLWAKVKDFFLTLNKKVRLLIAIVLIAVLGIAIITFVVSKAKPYSVLFTGLSGEEARAIVSYLDDSGVTTYRLEGGNTIKVPSNMEANLKARLLMEGYPKSGFAYETYRSAVGTMSTESDRNIAYLQDLQDRMAGVIRCLDGVKDAVVTIAQEEDRRYILDSSNFTQASASVIVTMQNGAGLSTHQADAIRNLVSHAVQGLEISNVAISDSLGNVYSSGDASSATNESFLLKLQLEEQLNNSIRTQVMQVLTPLFGEDNVRVAVNSTVDVSHTVGESTTYTEPQWAADGQTGGQGIIGSHVYDREVIRDPDDTVGGVVGTESNADIPGYVNDNIQVNGDEQYIHDSGTVDYNVDTEKEQVERWGTVTDVMVSVTINSEAAKSINTNNLQGHIARAAGIGSENEANKISVFVGSFYQETAVGGGQDGSSFTFTPWMLYAAIGGLALLLILLIVFSILRKKKSKKKKTQHLSSLMDEHLNLVAAQASASGADIMAMKSERSMELRKDIRQFAEDSPEIAAYMLKNWLRGGDNQDG